MCVCIPAKEVPGLSRVGISLKRFLQTLDSIALSAGSVPKLFNCVMHPAWNKNRVIFSDREITHTTKYVVSATVGLKSFLEAYLAAAG